jgi:hypothetical protein
MLFVGTFMHTLGILIARDCVGAHENARIYIVSLS